MLYIILVNYFILTIMYYKYTIMYFSYTSIQCNLTLMKFDFSFEIFCIFIAFNNYII
jgi:hypothetical protein